MRPIRWMWPKLLHITCFQSAVLFSKTQHRVILITVWTSSSESNKNLTVWTVISSRKITTSETFFFVFEIWLINDVSFWCDTWRYRIRCKRLSEAFIISERNVGNEIDRMMQFDSALSKSSNKKAENVPKVAKHYDME